MVKFTYFSPKDLSTVPSETIEMQTDAEQLIDVIENFERFLRAIGYHFHGHLDLVLEDSLEVSE